MKLKSQKEAYVEDHNLPESPRPLTPLDILDMDFVSEEIERILESRDALSRHR